MTGKQSNYYRIKRLIKHLFFDEKAARRLIGRAGLRRLEAIITQCEKQHRAEVSVAIESSYGVYRIWAGTEPWQRANSLFSRLGIWDTEENNGALLYLCLADRRMELRVDRGIAAKAAQVELDAVVFAGLPAMQKGQFVEGVEQSLRQLELLLTKLYPLREGDANELSNAPYWLGNSSED